MVKYIKSKAEFAELLEESNTKLVVVDFTASWCGPCQMIAPAFEKMAADNPTATFVKVDVDETEDVAAECGIRAMPTFHLYKGGKKVEEFSGADAAKLEALVKKHL